MSPLRAGHRRAKVVAVVGAAVRVLLICSGLILMLAGGAVAGAQYAPPDLSRMLDGQPALKDILLAPEALYAGSGAAGLGFVLLLLASLGRRKTRTRPAVRSNADTQSAPPQTQPAGAAERPRSASGAAGLPTPPTPAPSPPGAAPPAPRAKPQASAQPPQTLSPSDMIRSDPRFLNRRRVGELVTINDALKAYHARHGTYPVAQSLLGRPDRGEAWIPGLTPDFLPELPRDPAMSVSPDGPQYVYASDGRDYKLLARNISLVGGTPVEVLGVKIDPAHTASPERAAFGFWTAGYESA